MPRPDRRSADDRTRCLRPGAVVLRRELGSVQVGVDPDRAVVVDDGPGVRAVLGLAEPAARPRATPDTQRLTRALRSSGVLVDARPLTRVPAPLAPVLAQLMVDLGDAAAAVAVFERRRSAIVELRDTGPYTPVLADVLAQAGIGHLLVSGTGQPPVDRLRRMDTTIVTTGRSPRTDVVVVAAAWEPDRAGLEDVQRDGTAHLVLRSHDGCGLLGPFVLPGRTACLRCVDSGHAERDPAWPVLLGQLQPGGRPLGRSPAIAPSDPAVTALMAAWAAADVLTYLAGRRPATQAATIRLTGDLTDLSVRQWARHPACGCCWSPADPDDEPEPRAAAS